MSTSAVPPARSSRLALLAAAVTGVVLATAVPAAADPHVDLVVVADPDAGDEGYPSSVEGIAQGRGATFYVGELFGGDVFRGNLRTGVVELFIDIPADDRMAVGMRADLHHGLLFVAGGPGAAYVYDLRTGATVATYALGDPAAGLVNDVALTREGAWFTDSLAAQLYFVPVGRDGVLGEARTLELSGPAAQLTGEFDLNGIVATRSGVLIVGHSGTGELYTVDPGTGASAVVEGVSVPAVDGLVLDRGRLWVVQNELNQVSEVRLSRDLAAGEVVEVITDERFQVPTTAIHHRGRLAVVNAKFDTGIPPTADQYEVVLVDD